MRPTHPKPHRSARRRFPPLLILAGVAALALAAIAALSASAQPQAQAVPIETRGAPKLKVDFESIDLGNLPLGTTTRATFRVSNAGDQPLRVAKAPSIQVLEGC
jgi:hypothetical protein